MLELPGDDLPIREKALKLGETVGFASEEEVAGNFKCAACRDTGWNFLASPVTRCECTRERLRLARFRKAIELTPRKFRELHGITDGLASIAPDAKIHPRQPGILRELKEHPVGSYFFFGETGTHKTSFACALMQEAGRRGQLVNFAVGKTAIDDIRNFQLNKTAPASRAFYSLEQLETEESVCLVIDELDDTLATFSSYTLSTLFAIVELVQAYRHQLIVTSNDSLETILTNWCERDPDNKFNTTNYAKKIGRRLKEICRIKDLS